MASQEHQPPWDTANQDTPRIDENFEPLLSAAQAADLLGGMHVKTLMQMARKRRVPAHKIGRFWYFRVSELNDWLNSSCTPSLGYSQKTVRALSKGDFSMTRARYQAGCITLRKRAKGPDIWQFRWWELNQTGVHIQRSRIVGTIERFPHETRCTMRR